MKMASKTAQVVPGSERAGTLFVHLCSEYSVKHCAAMGALLSILRAVAAIQQSHHWQSRGNMSYGDHLMYDRIYSESLPLIDQWAERTVGTGGHLMVDPGVQAHQMSTVTRLLHTADEYAIDYAPVSLAAEDFVVWAVDATRQALKLAENLSSGTDNLLQGIADKHEEFTYLLRQRDSRTASTRYTYDRR